MRPMIEREVYGKSGSMKDGKSVWQRSRKNLLPGYSPQCPESIGFTTDSRQKPWQKPIPTCRVVVNSCKELHSRR